MTGGIHIATGTNATINGIEIQKCVDVAIAMAKGLFDRTDGPEGYAPIAHKAAQRMTKARAKGYSRQVCRDILWATVVDEAQRCGVAQSVEQRSVKSPSAGSSPAPAAKDDEDE